jgi:hypothetical protein
MAKRNRTTLLKRQREADKRERQAKRAAKAARKRERRLQDRAQSQIASGEDVQDNAASNDVFAAATNVRYDASAPSSGANARGSTATESGR